MIIGLWVGNGSGYTKGSLIFWQPSLLSFWPNWLSNADSPCGDSFPWSLLNRVEKITTGQTIEVGWRRDLLNAIIGGWFALRDAVLQVIFLLLSFLTGTATYRDGDR